MRYALPLALLVLFAAPRAEAADTADHLRDGWSSVQAATAEASIWAERAVIAGGVVLYRHRHTVSGAVLGCAAGSALGAASALAAGTVTGGAAAAAMPQAAAVGCGVGASAGIALGYPLDHLFDE